MDLLGPFIRGEVPKNNRWNKALDAVSLQIPDQEVEATIPVLERMFHNPFDPSSNPETAIPGTHGLYQRLTARRANFEGKER